MLSRPEPLPHYYYGMRLLKKIVLGVIGGILAVYLVFAIGLTVLEWIVRENPKVEHSLRAHSTDPHLLTHFDQGAASFNRRLELIASARQYRSRWREAALGPACQARRDRRRHHTARHLQYRSPPLIQRFRFLLEMPVANLFDFLL